MTDLGRALAEGGTAEPVHAPPGSDLAKALAEGGTAEHVGEAPKATLEPPKAAPSVWERLGARLKSSASNIASTVSSGAKAVGEAATHPLQTITDPARRRQFERGLDDMVTLGYGQRLAARIGNALGDKPDVAIGPQTFGGGVKGSGGAPVGNTQAADQEAAPEFRQLGNVVGMFTPGAANAVGKAGGAVAARALGNVAAKTVPQAAGLGLARSVLGYEATAPVQAALSADAEGHRLDAAKEAATDPLGLALSAAGGAAGGAVKGDVAHGGARSRAIRDIDRDITAAEGPKARVTDQKKIAEVKDRLFQLTKENPGLRPIWRQPAEKALPKIEAIKDYVAKPLDGLYAQVDANTGGGMRLGDIIGKLQDQAAKLSKAPSTIPDADRLAGVAKVFERAWGSDPERRIPTADFRAEVTALHKTAESVMGGIEGTPRFEALAKLYDAGKKIIDEHLDASGLPPDQLKQLRKINDQYFLLTRAENAIESRGWKEANRHGGFHLPHSIKGALTSGVVPAAAYGAMNPHSIPYMLGAIAATKAAPAVASRLNWWLANLPPEAAARLQNANEGNIGADIALARSIRDR